MTSDAGLNDDATPKANAGVVVDDVAATEVAEEESAGDGEVVFVPKTAGEPPTEVDFTNAGCDNEGVVVAAVVVVTGLADGAAGCGVDAGSGVGGVITAAKAGSVAFPDLKR